MEARLHHIDAARHLYRGYGREWPILVWEAGKERWAKCELPTPQGWDWGVLVTEREAERCYPGSTNAPLPQGTQPVLHDVSAHDMMRYRPEIFDDYDFGTMPRKSPEEEAEDYADFEEALPEDVRSALAKRKTEWEIERARILSEGEHNGS